MICTILLSLALIYPLSLIASTPTISYNTLTLTTFALTYLITKCLSVQSLVIHPAVVDLAKVEFSRFRDVREAIQQYDGVVASCLVLAFQGSTSEVTLSSP